MFSTSLHVSKRLNFLKFLDKLEQVICEIVANERYFATEDTKWNLPELISTAN